MKGHAGEKGDGSSGTGDFDAGIIAIVSNEIVADGVLMMLDAHTRTGTLIRQYGNGTIAAVDVVQGYPTAEVGQVWNSRRDISGILVP
jgi:hypothetical protein